MHAAGSTEDCFSTCRGQVPNEERIMCDFRLLINGRLVEGADTLDVINPATGRVLKERSWWLLPPVL
jgi:hypothetical protein